MTRWRGAALAVSAAVVLVAGAGSGLVAGTGPVRLLSISSRIDPGTAMVLIEAAEPVAYMASRPDPLTVVIDLRNVDASGVRNRAAESAGGVIAGVQVARVSGPGGQPIARVNVQLVSPLPHSVRSDRGTIHLEFDRARAPDAGRAARRSPAPVPADATGGAPSVRSATVLRSVNAAERADGVVVTLGGTGRLLPRAIGMVDDPPHRIYLDFAGVAASVPRSTDVDLGPVERVRVAPHSRSPLVTRVVIDLSETAAYTILPSNGDGETLAVLVRRPAAPLPDPIEALQARAPPRPADAEAAAPTAPSRAGPAPPAIPRPAEPGTTTRTPDGGLLVDASGTTMTTARFIVPAERVPDAGSPWPAAGAAAPAAPRAGQVAAAGQPGEPQFTGHPVTLDFQNADLRAVLRTFAEISGLNLVIDPAVSGVVDVALREVPWDQALDIILRSNGLGYTVDGTVVRIAPYRVLQAEQEERRKLVEEQRLSGELHVLTRTLSYARASALAELITRAALSARGSVQVDERTNTLIITDLRSNLDTAAELIATLDGPEPQVEIEARIVQSTRDFAREIGVQWGMTARAAPDLGNTTGLAFPNRGSLSGRTGLTDPGQGDPRGTELEASGTVVNLPATAPTSALGIALGAVNGALNLDVALSAAERAGQARILSTPKVATQNNQEAEITQGVQIPIQTIANNTVTVTFKDAALTLKVTPQITSADTVIMRVELENATADFSRQVGGIPPINTQRAITQLQVDDGQTTVIGGIFEALEQSVRDRTPGMSRIPLLGWLFRRDDYRDESRELLIFITPRIIRM